MDAPYIAALPPPSGDQVDWTITDPGTYVGAWTDGLEGMRVVGMEARFFFGASADEVATVKVYIQSSMDGGTTGYDIWRFDFAKATAWSLANSSANGLAATVAATDGTMTTDLGKAFPLGDRLRAKVVVVGTYTNTVLSLRVLPS